MKEIREFKIIKTQTGDIEQIYLFEREYIIEHEYDFKWFYQL
ncbi:hypothetical protein SH2C18_29040 [Clostridium sediminicola]